MSKILDIIGMCHLISELDYHTDVDNEVCGKVTVYGLEAFDGTVEQCHAYVSLYKRKAEAQNLADLLEKICRGNIELVNKAWNWDDLLDAIIKMTNELEEVYLSDDEVNERAIQEKQG